MKDEIKEILDKLNSGVWEKDEQEISYKILFSNEVYQLLDYIKKLKNKLEDEKKNYKRITTYLQEENERLKEWKKDLLDENIGLENIRKEATEYINSIIENTGPDLYNDDLDDLHILLNLLQGKSDENE